MSSAKRLMVLQQHLSNSEGIQQTDPRCLYITNSNATTDDNPQYAGCQPMDTFPSCVSDVFKLDNLLSREEQDIRSKVRLFMEQEVAPIIVDYWHKDQFPFELLPRFAALGLGGGVITGYGCPGHSILGAAITIAEIARVDASLSTFVMLHNSLVMLTIDLLGSEEQKSYWLPRMAQFEVAVSWALTEPGHGSDASGLQTSAKKVDGGWLLTGRKRWIGNATVADVICVWARNEQTSQVNCFLVRKGSPGLVTTKMEYKTAQKCLQNADILLTDVFVPDSARLPGANSFQDTNKVLATSRIMVTWQPVGVAMGVYDMVHRYTKQRTQFGTPLAAFQITQEKLSRMLGSIQAMALMAWRLSKLHEAGKMTHGMSSLTKAWNTLRAREVVALGREMLGSNGVLSNFLVAKAFCDMEAMFSYEGTYEVNALVMGRETTGYAAFKAAS